MAEFDISKDRLLKVAEDIVAEMESGLAGNPSSLLMLPTYVHKLPDSNMRGNYLALDFGGSTFRVVHVKLEAGKEPVTKSSTSTMDASMKTVEGKELFDHLASRIASFVQDEHLEYQELPLGFTFSFPMRQYSISEGSLVRWTKGFQNQGVEDQDVGLLLSQALQRNSVTSHIIMKALANDTAGTQVSGAVRYSNCHGGFIIGTGSNACYTEKVANVASLKNCKEDNVIINIELGNFGERGHVSDLLTKHDKVLDDDSVNTGKQLYEKMISGMYMGEMVRLALLDRSGEFEAAFPGELKQKDFISGAEVSDFIADKAAVRKQFSNISDKDIELIQTICNAVSNRAAKLTAAGMHAIWLKRHKENFIVAVDGSVYIKHATFSEVLRRTLLDLGTKVELRTASDGSGLGSALIASTA